METELTRKVNEKVNELVDEETARKFGELNLVTDISETTDGSVKVTFRPLSPYSPLAVDIGRSIREASLSVEGVRGVRVECVGHMMDDLVNRVVNKDDIARPKTM